MLGELCALCLCKYVRLLLHAVDECDGRNGYIPSKNDD